MTRNFILNTELTEKQAALFYLGQEGMMIKYHDRYFLIDPYLSDYVDRHCRTDKVQWSRRYPAPIQAEELDFVNYIFCTHEHFDHCDPDTLRALAQASPEAVFIVPLPATAALLSYGIPAERIIGARADTEITLDECKILPVPAAHEELHPDENGCYRELGYKLLFDGLTLYHAGDCCIYDGLAERLMDTDVLMLPVNGRGYYKLREDIIGNMTAEEAVLLARETNAGMLIPLHYDLYDVNCINPAAFVDTLFSINPSQRFHMFAPGERYILSSEK